MHGTGAQAHEPGQARDPAPLALPRAGGEAIAGTPLGAVVGSSRAKPQRRRPDDEGMQQPPHLARFGGRAAIPLTLL